MIKYKTEKEVKCMKMLLKNGTLIDYKTNTFEKFDILIQEEKIVKIIYINSII